MKIRELKERYLPDENAYYEHFYPFLLILVIVFFIAILVAIVVLRIEIKNRPDPIFTAVQDQGQHLTRGLTGTREPNLLPSTIIRFASQAAVLGYNFTPVESVNVRNLNLVKPYFTSNGWTHYVSSVMSIVQRVQNNSIYAYGVVTGPAVISNQGELPDVGYAWRVQIPFMVTFRSGEIGGPMSQRNYLATLTVIRVPTYINPQGIGVDSFVMA